MKNKRVIRAFLRLNRTSLLYAHALKLFGLRN